MVDSIIEFIDKRLIGGTICLFCFFASSESACGQSLTFSANNDEKSTDFGSVSIFGLEPRVLSKLDVQDLDFRDWVSFFRVSVSGSTRAVIGSYAVQNEQITFKPRFLPDSEVIYEVNFSPTELGELISYFFGKEELRFSLRFETSSPKNGQLVGFSPNSNVLPSNVLRLYLHFSEPMSMENPYRFISIENEKGTPVIEPFVEIEEGLWNPSRTRLTLLLHPGRIKRGVGPNVTQGGIFVEGERYRLLISPEWKTAAGASLEGVFQKRFSIGKPLRSAVDLESWEIDVPQAGTLHTLEVRTDRLLDKALAERLLSVEDEQGKPVDGGMVFDTTKRMLQFKPANHWVEKTYKLVIDPKLEDVCGNTPIQAFDLEGSGMVKDEENINLAFCPK